MKKVVRWLYVLSVLLFAFTSSAITSINTTLAITSKEYVMYAQNDIMFYNPTESKRNNKTCYSEPGENTNYAGDQVWTDDQLETIKNNQAIYLEAAEEYGIPWELLAVVHYMETGLSRKNPSSGILGQGLYGLSEYTNGGTSGGELFKPGKELSDEEFLEQSKIAAKTFADYGLDFSTDEGVKRMLFKYNGAAQNYIDKALAMGFSQEEAENGEGSPYVMNRYDAERDPTSGEMGSNWPGIYTGDHVYDSNATSERFGTFVLYQALKGDKSVCTDTDGGVGGWADGDLVFYLQYEGDWANDPYGCASQTIANGGCGPTSLASVIATMTGDSSVTPRTIAQIAEEKDYAVCGQGSYHGIAMIAEDFGLTVTPHTSPSIEEVSEMLRNGSMFHIVGGGGPPPFNSDGHFIALRGVTDDGQWLIFDPGNKENNSKEWDPHTIADYVKDSTWYEIR